jgi:hypothetical protein
VFLELSQFCNTKLGYSYLSVRFSQTWKERVERTALATVRFMKLNGEGTTSPSCRSKPPKSMVLISSLAGVPVCSRPSLNPAALREAERPIEGASLSRPAGNRLRPEKRVRTGKWTKRAK